MGDDAIVANVSHARIYPNPTSGNLNIVTEVTEESNLVIFDRLGRTVLETTVSNESNLDLNHLAKGVYLVRIANTSGITTQRLVKE